MLNLFNKLTSQPGSDGSTSDSSEKVLPEIPPAKRPAILQHNRIQSNSRSFIYKAFLDAKPVALKVIDLDVDSFENEKSFYAKIQHPHILKCLGFWDDGLMVICLELMASDYEKYLQENIEQNRDLEKCWNILLGAAKGLAYLHEIKIIHADVKPGNILVDYKNNPKLADFGMSKQLPDNELVYRSQKILGTPAYAAPEAQETNRYTLEFDTYAFGGVILTTLLLSKWYLFQNIHATVFAFKEAHLQGRLPSIPSCATSAVRDLIIQCQNRDPFQRASAQKIVDVLTENKLVKKT